jgi:hypothetical protein
LRLTLVHAEEDDAIVSREKVQEFKVWLDRWFFMGCVSSRLMLHAKALRRKEMCLVYFKEKLLRFCALRET